MKSKGKILLALLFALLFAALVWAVGNVAVAAIGPQGTSVGFAELNRTVHEMTGVHMLWYDVTDWLGLAAIAVAAVFALSGFVQLIRRRSLLKIDREIWLLAVLYIVVIGLYVLFEMFIVNYRPVIMPGENAPEASFPSSHTMLVCVVLGSAMKLMGKYIKAKGLRVVLRLLCALVIAVTIVGRLISGVHWFTDIVGGLLISAALLALFSAAADAAAGRRGKHEQ